MSRIGRAAAGVADRIGREQRPPRGRHLRRRRREHGRREEPAHHQVLDRRHAVLEHRAAARLHRLRIGQPRRGVGEHEVRQPLRRVRPRATARSCRRATSRRTRTAATPHASASARTSLRELGDRVVAGGDARCPVPSRVVAQHLEVRQQIRRLRVPHAVVEAERMRQHEHRAARRRLRDGNSTTLAPVGITGIRGSGFRVQGSGFRVHGFRVQGSGGTLASKRVRRISAAPR